MKVLIVSNDRALLRHASRFLATFGYETTQAADYERAGELADSLAVDLLLVDAAAAPDRALELCRAVSQRHGAGGHHTLLIVDEQSSLRLLDAIEAGADDFLSRPLVYGEVLMRLQAGARAVQFQRRLREQRRTDPATGLLTAAAFYSRLEASGAGRGLGSGEPVCVVLELDFFEHLVRHWGAAVEEQLLRQFGMLLRELGGNDVAELAHLGAGEFVAILPDSTAAEAVGWAERVRAETAATKFLADQRSLSLTVSAGVAGGEAGAASWDGIVEKSRQALRTAKASGGDCVSQAGQFAEEEAAWKDLAAPGRLFQRTLARDVMLPCTVVLHSRDTIGAAESLLRQTRLTSLVVVDRQEKLVGMVLAEDVAEYLEASGDPAQPVSRIMTQRIDTFTESTPFADVVRRFAEKEIETVVVVEGDFPTGIVSAASLASLGHLPGRPAFCLETPSVRSGYLQLAEPFAVAAPAGEA